VVISNLVPCYHGVWVNTSGGREIDGDDDGQPGGDYIATISGTRLTTGGLPLAHTRRQTASIADVVDHLLARGELVELGANRQRRAGSAYE
jgi:hypothetical protein